LGCTRFTEFGSWNFPFYNLFYRVACCFKWSSLVKIRYGR
jgi:hypothetical protein